MRVRVATLDVRHRVSEPGAMEVKGKGGESSGEQELSSLPLFLKVV